METPTTKRTHEDLKTEGLITFTKYSLNSPRAIELDKILETATGDQYRELVAELDSICPKEVLVRKNLVVLAGRSVTASIWAGETTYTGIINYGLLGTGSTAVADSDTQLVAEVKRKAVATRTRVGAQVNFDFYYSKSDTSGTYNEFGMVIDGTTTANTGQLFNRLLTGGWTKTALESMTVSVQINHNNA